MRRVCSLVGFGALALGSLPASIAPVASAQTRAEVDHAADARALDRIVAENYAYLDRFADGRPPRSVRLDAMRDAVRDGKRLLAYAEAVTLSLADHHAITGSSFSDSWAVVPSYADLWVVRDAGGWRIDAVRDGSPAMRAGVRAGDRLVAVGGVPIDAAVAGFWGELGMAAGDAERDAFAVRVLAAGRRDRPRDLTFHGRDGEQRLTLPSLYAEQPAERPPLTLLREAGSARIAIHNALGDDRTIAAFDAAMASIPRDLPVEIDLTDTPSGGNTVIARAILGWFVERPANYQMHNLPSEERRTGIARQWIEQAMPRAGKFHHGPVTVRVGRWTGSMGEGLAIGFDAIGASIRGGPMAGLLGAIHDFRLPSSGLVVKLPAERLMTIDGMARERFVPAPTKPL